MRQRLPVQPLAYLERSCDWTRWPASRS